MSKRVGRRNKNRPPKPPSEPKRKRTPLPESHVVGNTGPSPDGTVTMNLITHQDSVLPVRLNFAPPLASLGADPSAFDYNWQHLTYAFQLPDPADFPAFTVPISDTDRRSLKRFVYVCEKTAQYTVVSHKGGIRLSWEGGETTITVDQTKDEETVGFSVRFRQLHSLSGDPDFSTVANLLGKYIAKETDGFADERKKILSQWREARTQLTNRPLANIVCRMVLEKDGCPPYQIPEMEMYGDVNPTDIINLFNYGELIHFGRRSEDYDEIAEDPEHQAVQHQNFMVAMSGLVHLYFGFSELIRAALDLPAAPTRRGKYL